ncbi:MAG: glutaminyl-peptide cyclotransferase [Bacteroidales bacterium]|nr:glutaminyl-peptide cyclotransferase [Bacteroidales bacterium]MBN2818411.1 glutaminyl-peptide cyclotransferase [Bacteroidales bacterium]
MIKQLIKFIQYAFITISLISIVACCSSQDASKEKQQNKAIQKTEKLIEITAPVGQETVIMGEKFDIHFKTKKTIVIDSVIGLADGEIVKIDHLTENKFTCTPPAKICGRKNIRLTIYHSDSLKETENIKIMLLPAESPGQIKYKVLRSFKHDDKAYTQGLLYYNGLLYESTGRKTSYSSLRCIDPKSGEILRKKELEPKYFGEGISLVNKEIYMLTYHAQLVFVFDLATFELKRKYDLQSREGWGLATYNNLLLASDGSAYIYFYEPEYFSLTHQIEVCNNQGLVNSINELEYTPYGLFANIYGTDKIVLIDVETGIVKAELNLSDLFPENTPADIDHVLNGIAYDYNTGNFYVTGKQWPVMYELSLSLD